jgi:hypothetical protein
VLQNVELVLMEAFSHGRHLGSRDDTQRHHATRFCGTAVERLWNGATGATRASTRGAGPKFTVLAWTDGLDLRAHDLHRDPQRTIAPSRPSSRPFRWIQSGIHLDLPPLARDFLQRDERLARPVRRLGRCDVIKDLTRVERLVAEKPGVSGYAILLTNDSAYCKPARNAAGVPQVMGKRRCTIRARRVV